MDQESTEEGRKSVDFHTESAENRRKRRVCTIQIVYRFSKIEVHSVKTHVKAISKREVKTMNETEELTLKPNALDDQEKCVASDDKNGKFVLGTPENDFPTHVDCIETKKETKTDNGISVKDNQRATCNPQNDTEMKMVSTNLKETQLTSAKETEKSHRDIFSVTTFIKFQQKQKSLIPQSRKLISVNPSSSTTKSPNERVPSSKTAPTRPPRPPRPPRGLTGMSPVETTDFEEVFVKRLYYVKRIGGGYSEKIPAQDNFFSRPIPKLELSRYDDATTRERVRTNQRWRSIYSELMNHLKVNADSSDIKREFIKEFESHVHEQGCKACECIQDSINERRKAAFHDKRRKKTTFWAYMHWLGFYARKDESEVDSNRKHFKQHERIGDSGV